MVEAALRAANFTTGLTISPHLVDGRERIQLNGQLCPLPLWQAAEQAVSQADPDNTLSYFERHMAMAFWAFATQNVDWAIIETGVGGRLDASNVLAKPALCAITTIGLDHQEWLGDTVDAIAAEKAGIIKSGVPVVVGPSLQGSVLAVITQVAAKRHAPVIPAIPGRLEPLPIPYAVPQTMRYQDTVLNRVWTLPLLGQYQQANLTTATTMLDTLYANNYPVGHAEDWLKGIAQVAWPGRFHINQATRWIVDGSHNIDGFATLVDTLAVFRPGQALWPMGLLLTLKANRPFTILSPLLQAVPWQVIWVTRGPDDDYHPPDVLAQAVETEKPGVTVVSVDSLVSAKHAIVDWQQSKPDGWVLATGSLYSAGALLAQL
jgi:dihydrofolate synthase / folylpolyglutamate synthase